MFRALACALFASAFVLWPQVGDAQQRQQSPPQAPPQLQQPPTRPLSSDVTDPALPIYILMDPAHAPRIERPADWNSAARTFPEPDHDRDGHRTIYVGGDDCDDNDDNRAPGLPEVGDWNGHDEDCNDETIGVNDQDQDGFTSWRVSQVLRTMAGRPYAILRGADCDDRKREVNPSMPEVLGDQLDNNCDGAIDLIVRPGHEDYCSPTTTSVRLSQMLVACARPSGDARRY